MFRKTALALGCATVLGFSASAQAATTINFTIGSDSGTFTANNVACDGGIGACSGSFSTSGEFAGPAGYRFVGGTITSNATNALTDIDFTSVTLNGAAFDLVAFDGELTPGTPFTRMFEFGTLSPITLETLNTLVVSGYTGGAAAFSGTLAFTTAIPEPATWALMILGFGAVGVALRRRQKVSAKLNFA